MRKGYILAASMLLAAFGGGTAAQAAVEGGSTLGDISADVMSSLAPSQYDSDGSVYGVRARVSGSGTEPIAASGPQTGTSPTPGNCATAGFPGGWCDTAHDIAKNAFGWTFPSGEGGQGVIIGMIDTGIDLNSPEFLDSHGASRVLPGHCVTSSVNPCTSTNDQLGGDLATFPNYSTHGTHTTGIAAGLNVGIANQASILPVKVCGSFVDSCNGVDDGIVWASQHGAAIISVSIGGPILTANDISMLKTAVANGSLLVVAAGNAGKKDPVSGYLGGAALADGIRGSMIVVGATGAGGTGGHGTIASFSQVPGSQCQVEGTQRYCMADYFVVAPGVDIWSSVGNGANPAGAYGYLSGTSMATPYVAGVAAVIKGQWPTLTSSQVASIIFHTADNLGTPGVNAIYGWGAVDITKALSPVGPSVVVTGGSLSTNLSTGNSVSPTVTGLSGAQVSLVSGPLSVAVANSKLLKTAVVVDSYGRNFTANLTNATYNPGFDFTTTLLSSQFSSYSPFSFSMQGPLGVFTASGVSVDTTMPRLLAGELMTHDRQRYTVSNLEVDDHLMPGVDLNLGYNLAMSGHFSAYDSQASEAYDGLFMSAAAVNSPYASLTNGGSYVGSTVTLADDVHMHFGESMLNPQRPQYEVPVFSYLAQVAGPQSQYDMRRAQTSLAGVDWDFASWGGLGVVATQTSEENGLLGGFDSGSLSVAKTASTSAVGVSARIGFGDGWVTTFSYNEGITQLSLKPNALISGADTLRSRSYGLAIAKHGLFGDDDSMGFAVSRPLQVYSGGVDLTLADGVDTVGDLKIGHEYLSLSTATPETDLELGYVTTFLNGALALQANAGYQMNVAGLGGTNSLSVISRAKINF